MKQDLNIFHIGHQEDETQTKKPEFESVKAHGRTYGDLVGLLDTSNEAGNHIAQLLWQQIYRSAKSVKFIVALTANDFEEYERHD